jgi:dsRNA-specific ribonuclease
VRWDTEIKFEQTKRFIDDEINRRIKEEKDKKQAQDQKHLTYTSLRDQLNLQY